MPNRLHESYVVVGSLTGYAYSDMLCRNGEAAEADGTPAVTCCVVDHAADPRPPGSMPYDTKTIDLFRKIAAIPPTLSDILVEPEIETYVTQYIEQSIREYEACANQTVTNATILPDLEREMTQ